jgi:hypothetical protein
MTFAGLAQQSPLVYPGGHGPGRGKHVVLIAGDQEYRSEESIPALAQILAVRHGFQCTVLFSVNRQTGRIDPNTIDNIPGLEALRRADLVVLFARWLELPDEQMKEIIDYTELRPADRRSSDLHSSVQLSEAPGKPVREVQL